MSLNVHEGCIIMTFFVLNHGIIFFWTSTNFWYTTCLPKFASLRSGSSSFAWTLSSSAWPKGGNTHVIVRDIKDSKHVKTQHYIKSGSVKSGHVKHVKLLIGASYCFHFRSMSWSKKPVVFCVSLFPCATVLPASLALKQTTFGSVTVKVKDLHFRPTASLDFPPCCHVGESCCDCSAASAHDDDASTARVSACHAASHGSRSSRCCYWGRLWWQCGSRGWCIIKVRSFSTTRTKLWQREKCGNSQVRHIHFQATPCSTEWGLRRVEWEPGWFSDMWVVKSRVAHFDLAPYTASTFNFNCCFPCLGFGFVLVFFDHRVNFVWFGSTITSLDRS